MAHQVLNRGIAFLGSGSVVSQSLRVLLEAEGYEIRLLGEQPQEAKLGELLDGVALLLVLPRHNPVRLEGFLLRMRSTPATAAMPVITLKTALDKPQKDGQENHILLPWPSPMEDLKRTIEASLRAPAPLLTTEADVRPS